MSSKKTKLLESAQKNFLKGLYDRAASEYRQIIEFDPADVRHRQRLAEILAKANKKDEAIKEYTTLAKTYIDTVHYLKAIAVYKQIQKLDPANPEISLTLASLNEKQGLNGNAIAEYSAAIQIFESNGENTKSLKALESMLAIDPKNSAARLRLAEKYFTVGDEQKSADIFTELAADLRRREDDSGFARVAEKISLLFGNDAQKVFKRIAPDEPADSAAEVEEPPTAIIEPPVAPVDNIVDEPAAFAEPPENEEPQLQAEEFAYDEILEDAELIEDIQPLDDIEEITNETEDQEWEEEIDLETAVATDDFQMAPEAPAAAAVEPPEFEFDDDTADFPAELDDIELEIEIEDTPQELQQADGQLEPAASAGLFDLGAEMSLFANEIDFDLPRAEQSDNDFDFTSPTGFKKADLDNEDTESHYSLGLAYREMGLYDEAIGEFTVASRSPERKVDCLILQGICFRDMGNTAKALEIFSDTINLGGLNEDEILGIKYELATCREISGDQDAAMELYREILEKRPDFSDTAAKLAALRK
ncbi:MAG: tetratricopeptide repeat protein [Geobacter sp.]|nr:tetratricopeptide repeat protein [Geobacter sp.]